MRMGIRVAPKASKASIEFPDVKDLDVAVPRDRDMMGPSRWSSNASGFELLDRRVVLLGREFAVGEVDSDCHSWASQNADRLWK